MHVITKHNTPSPPSLAPGRPPIRLVLSKASRSPLRSRRPACAHHATHSRNRRASPAPRTRAPNALTHASR